MGLGPPGYVHEIDPDPDDPRAGELLTPWDGDPVDVGILGVPFDGCVPGRKGARRGPSAIREALRYNTTYHAGADVELSDLDVADLGDLEVTGDPADVHADLVSTLEDLRGDVDRLVLLGGDHSLTHPTASAWAGGATLGLVYVDAHLDVRSFPPWSSGNSFRRLVEDDIVPGPNLVNLGARPFLNSRHHVRWAKKQGATVLAPGEIRDRGVDRAASGAVETATDGTDALYFSLDVDGVDQSHAPGASAPSPGGLDPPEVFWIARGLGRAGAVAMDICEVAPSLDPTGNTSRVAATAVLHFLAGLAEASTF